ncbi:DUF541 domain-containing protein [archaeon]|nr:MAG: DUF541 domain-containing protein [archaeon]
MDDTRMTIGTIGTILIVIGIVAVGLLAMGMGDTTVTIDENPEDRVLSVTGTTQMAVEPDLVEVSVGVSVLRPTAAEAQEAEDMAINDIVDGLIALGIPEEDIETSQISLHEEQRWIREEMETVGWRASQTLTVSSTDLTLAGPIIDTAVQNGANKINGVTFSLTEESKQSYQDEALTAAAQRARDKAEAIAEGLGVSLGNVKTVRESSAYIVPYDYRESVLKDEMSDAPAVVLPGDVTVTGTISVDYIIE